MNAKVGLSVGLYQQLTRLRKNAEKIEKQLFQANRSLSNEEFVEYVKATEAFDRKEEKKDK